MVVNCEVEFDGNTVGTFFAGQLVNGSVILKSDKPKDVKGVLLKISGYALTRWSEKHFNQRRHFTGREDYLSSITYLLGSEENSTQKQVIESGSHIYTFACQLPQQCPSSFEGLHGCVRYVVKVVLLRPWKFDQTYSRGFTVLKTVDLNYEPPIIRVPSNSQTYKIFCCGPCKSEPLKMELHIPHAGYVPGQMIPVTCLVINNTNIHITEVKFSLAMLVRYYSKYPVERSRIERISVTKIKGESVLRNCTRSLTENIAVPATPPTCLQFCNLIQIAYQIEVEAKMKGYHGNHLVTLPVTIGNVPLWHSIAVQQQPQSIVGGLSEAEVFQESDIGNKMNVSTISGKESILNIFPADMPPPSYEESVHTESGDINEGELHAFGPCQFTPLYPVFKLDEMRTNQVNQQGSAGYINQNFEN